MSDDEINTAMAEAMGWRKEDGVYMWTANDIDCTCNKLWDWANDLNAMHLAEKTLKGYERIHTYVWNLQNRKDWVTDFKLMEVHASARDRAEAFLRTLGKWKGAQP